jgi:hypothetical protein
VAEAPRDLPRWHPEAEAILIAVANAAPGQGGRKTSMSVAEAREQVIGTREVADIAAATMEAVERGGTTLSLPAATALSQTLHERVGRIVDEREEAITEAMEYEASRGWKRLAAFLHRLADLVGGA